MSDRFSFKKLFERAELPGIADISQDKDVIRQGRVRLLALLFLFDTLLIVATLLSFRGDELVYERTVLEQTKEIITTQVYEEEVISTVTVIKVIPYGAPTPTPAPD